MSRVLILHHIEPMWERFFDPSKLLKAVRKHIKKNHYDRVILTTFEGTPGYPEIAQLVDTVFGWSYAWEDSVEASREVFDYLEPHRFIEVSTHHQVAYVYPWIETLRGMELFVCGGHRDECLQDLLETLEHLKMPYQTVESCIYG